MGCEVVLVAVCWRLRAGESSAVVKFSLSSVNSAKAPEGMSVVVLAGTESSGKFLVLSSSCWKERT